MRNKTGFAYSPLFFIGFVLLLTIAYIGIDYMTSFDTIAGEYSAAVVRAVQDAESAMFYIEVAAQHSVAAAARKAGDSSYSFNEAIDGEDSADIIDFPECGRYVFDKWSDLDEFCAPSSRKSSYEFFLSSELNRYLNSYPSPHVRMPVGSYDIEVEENEDGIFIKGTATSPLEVDMLVSPGGSPNVEDEAFAAAGRNTELLLSRGIIWPVADTTITSCFGDRVFGDGFHDGMDFGDRGSDRIRAIEEGVVESMCSIQACSACHPDKPGCQYNPECPEAKCSGLGNWVLIRHDSGFKARYNHMEYGSLNPNLQPGAKVFKGQVIGRMGNTGRSKGKHLDLKIYPSGSGTGAEQGRNPLCLYSNERLAELKTSGTASNCIRDFGKDGKLPVIYQREVLPQNHCSGIFLSTQMPQVDFQVQAQEEVEQEEQLSDALHTGGPLYEELKVGTYNIMPHFKVELDEVLPGLDNEFEEVVDWAEETWNNCEESPVVCLSASMNEFNQQNNSYELMDAYSCEEFLFYRKIVEAFESCLASEQSECVCRTSLEEIGDPNDYVIRFTGSRIEILEGPSEEMYDLGSPTAFFSQVPGDPSQPVEEMLLLKQESGIRLNAGQNSIEYPTLRLYKPEKDKVVVVNRDEPMPTCQEKRDTFLMCAQREDGNNVKFALQLKDNPPPQVKAQVDTLEENKEDVVKEAAVLIGANILGVPSVVIDILTDMLPEKSNAALQVTLDWPEEADISGFEVYCEEGNPILDLDLDNAVFAPVSNAYEAASGTVGRGFEYASHELVGECADQYVTLAREGTSKFVRKASAVMTPNGATLTIPRCSGNILSQLKSIATPEFCVTVVPVDSNGQRGTPTTECKGIPSMMTRALQQLGLEAETAYFRFVDDADNVMAAIRDGDFSRVVDYVGEIPGASEITNAIKHNIITDTIRDTAKDLGIENLRDVLERASDTQREVSNYIENEQIPERVRQELRKAWYDTLSVPEKKELLLKAVENFHEMAEKTQLEFTIYIGDSLVPFEVKKDVVKAAGKASEKLRAAIERAKNENLAFRAEGIDRGEFDEETGLYHFQTSNFFTEILRGEYGLESAKILMRKTIDALPAEQVEELFRRAVENARDPEIIGMVHEEIRQMPAEAKELLLEEMWGRLPKEHLEIIAEKARNAPSVARQMAEQFPTTVREAAGGLVRGVVCPEDPFENTAGPPPAGE